MITIVDGKKYIAVADVGAPEDATCEGCVAEDDAKLCVKLPNCLSTNVIYKEAPCDPT